MTPTLDKPKRPDVAGIEARAARALHSAFQPTAIERSLDQDIPVLIAYIEALEARQVKLEAVAEPLARVWALNLPININPAKPMREVLPGAWPRMCVCKNAYELLKDKLKLGKALADLGDGDG